MSEAKQGDGATDVRCDRCAAEESHDWVWQYEFATVQDDCLYEVEGSNLRKVLNDMGALGWELVFLNPTTTRSVDEDGRDAFIPGHYAVFKRPIPGKLARKLASERPEKEWR